MTFNYLVVWTSRVIVVNNGMQFNSKEFISICEGFWMEFRFTVVNHPWANGYVEVINRALLQSSKVRLDRAKSLSTYELPSVLWVNWTTMQTPTKETPFTEALLLVEVRIPNSWTNHFIEEGNNEALKRLLLI